MDLVYDLLVLLHLLGFAAVFGGLFVQVRSRPRVVNAAVVHGVLTQLVTGLLMVGMAESGTVDETVDHAKIGVKLAVALVIAGLAFGYRRRDSLSGGLYGALLGLAVLNTAVAVFWT